MKLLAVDALLSRYDAQGTYLYTVNDLRKVFGESGEALRSTIRRCVAQGILSRIARGLYAYGRSRNVSPTTIYEIAARLRRGEYVFEGLESAANAWGLTTQVPLGAVTLLTTGRAGRFDTPFGSIEFVHTSDAPERIVENTTERPGNPIPLATRDYTLEGLRHHRRSLDLLKEHDVTEGDNDGSL